jgi:6-pyruvoyltetrahydropterin/6-carboxytetrahydropterin synthase
MRTFHIRVADNELAFSAAHFITVAPDNCERLHGHNYRVAAEVEGPLDAQQCVVDFIALRELLRSILAELDHRVLLPTGHPTICVADAGAEIEVRFADRRWVFPRADCTLLPVANTTAECLAEYVAERLREALKSRLKVRPKRLRVEIEECFGLSAACEIKGGS